jgi:OmcA/MtrC family decaheme c-type cytochrome
MKFPHSRLVMAMAAGALIAVPASNPRLTRSIGPRGAPDPHTIYSAHEKEFYLTKDELSYIRPGFHLTLNSITIPEDRRPVVDFSFTDDFDQPLDRNGKVTPGTLSINQVLAWWDPVARHYTSYTTRKQTSPITNVTAIQAAADPQKSSSNPNGGVWTDHEVGHSSYRFSTVLPEGYDVTKTTTLAVYATRNLTDIIGKNYYDNLEYDFRPDGGTVSDTWDKSTNAACNRCHNVLSAHGGSRQDLKLCVTCHQPQTVDPDTGNTVDFKVMVHKIHRGENLPSVQAGTPYVIIGNNQSIHDFSDVVFPQDIRNCVRCHTPEATQSNVWYTFPQRAPCGACHDDINWVTGENHPGGPQADDSACASCHVPQGDREYDASIKGAHIPPYKSTQLKGLNSDISSVTNAAPGQRATVVFQITENDGTPVPPSSFTTSSGSSNLNLLMAGPTTDYATFPQIRERADAASFDGTNATFTFTTPIPADATGTWAFSIEARRDVNFTYPPPEGNPVREGALNHVHYADLSGGTPQPRRAVVDLALCNTCHDQLVLHGGQRFNTEECVFCHNPNGDDRARRPADKAPVESIDFKRMIHRIHTGKELTEDFTIYGFGGNAINFNVVRFPGDRRDCATCHIEDPDPTWEVQETLPPGRLPTQTLRDWYTPQQPTAAACLGCHDSQAAAAHAFTMTAPFGEACAACHGVDAEFSVDKVHAH